MSFTNLPAEVRSLIYGFLLRDAVSECKYIVYYGRQGDMDKRVFEFFCREQRGLLFRDRNSTYARHVDISNLLKLAATCRLLRSEILFLAWSNADICI